MSTLLQKTANQFLTPISTTAYNFNYSYTMCVRGLPDMYTLSPQAARLLGLIVGFH